MTDDIDQPDPHDLLASDHLDGRTTPAEAEMVAADPQLRARVDAMAAIREALRAEVPVDAAARRSALAAALSAFDDERTGADREVMTVTEPALGRSPSRRTLQLVAIAAAAVLLALAVPLLSGLGDGSGSEDTAATALEEESAEDGVDQPTAGGTADDSVENPAAAEAFALDEDGLEPLGAFDDLDGLETALRARVPSTVADMAVPTTDTAERSAGAAAPARPCSDVPRPAPGEPIFSGTAMLGGRPVLVLVHAEPDGRRQVTVVDPVDCSVVSTSSL